MGAIWLAWLASWVNRVELRTRAEGTVAALGLGFEREGLRSRVIAAGTIGGSVVRVRWRTGWFGPSTDVAVAGAKWERVPEEEPLEAWLGRRIGGGSAERPPPEPPPGASS